MEGIRRGVGWCRTNELMVVHQGRRKEEISGNVGMNEKGTLEGWDTVHGFGAGFW